MTDIASKRTPGPWTVSNWPRDARDLGTLVALDAAHRAGEGGAP